MIVPSVDIWLDQMAAAIWHMAHDDPEIIAITEIFLSCLKRREISSAEIWQIRPIIERATQQGAGR